MEDNVMMEGVWGQVPNPTSVKEEQSLWGCLKMMMGIVIIKIFGHNSIGYGNDIAMVMIMRCFSLGKSETLL